MIGIKDFNFIRHFIAIFLGLAVFVLQTVNGFFDHLNVNVVLSFFNHNQFLGYFLQHFVMGLLGIIDNQKQFLMFSFQIFIKLFGILLQVFDLVFKVGFGIN